MSEWSDAVHDHRWRRTLSTLLPAAVLATTAALIVGLTASPATASQGPGHNSGPGNQSDRLAITTVSNPRPSLVSGGQVLVSVSVPRGAHDVRVTDNGHDVTSAFRTQRDGSLLGLVTGLRAGTNVLAARSDGRGSSHAELKVDNHPITGPVFSGPQQTPFFCETTAFGLAPAVMPNCSAPTQVTFQYKNTAGAFVVLADPTSHPADLATATVNGHTVPYIVRVETGTIDRAVYQIAALYDGSDPNPLGADGSWNRALVYTFGGGCNAGYHQGNSTGGVINDLFLGQGYAVASSSLNVLDNNCSSVISAEAAMMVKEHFIDTYGPVSHTIGWGGSGGAIQQYTISDEYPGIVDGIIPSISFPDPLSTAGPVDDCKLLDNFFAGPGATFTAAQRQEISGYNDYTSCQSWDATFANRATATGSCNSAIPVAARWNPVTNPNGVKCNANEQLVNQFGRDPNTGFVRSTLDNTGVQYGMAALEAGQITADQFVTLNADMGGIDFTGALMPGRITADPKALNAAYSDDLLTNGGQGLRDTPIIDQRDDLDFAGFGNDIHTSEWSFAMRQRLIQANGTAANQVIIENQPAGDVVNAANAYELDAMNRWLTAIDADRSHRGLPSKVISDKPADLGDGCFTSATQRVVAKVTDPASGPCAAAGFPVATNPRQVAGEAQNTNVLKCALQPLNFAAYPVTFTADQKAQLRATFPTGVCNYNKPGVGQHRPIGSWLSYGDERTGLTRPTHIPGPNE
ncbi:MAG TPA: DUF6351 family protein [Pseudonocardiaceae bacterium]|nr:DUF6351 family protein [Pseudonocardiaceae bacterium]